MDERDQSRANALARQVDRLLSALERMRLKEYVEYVTNRRRLLLSSFLHGMARGFGFAETPLECDQRILGRSSLDYSWSCLI